MSTQTAIERIQRALSIAETTRAANPYTDCDGGLAAAHDAGILKFLIGEVRESIREHQADHYSGLVAELKGTK